MRLVASRPAPALLSSPAKRHVKNEIRHEAMSLVLAGIVATMVLATFKVTACASPFLLPFAHFSCNLLSELWGHSLTPPLVGNLSFSQVQTSEQLSV